MIHCFGRAPYGLAIECGCWWVYNTEEQRGFWVDANGIEMEPSGFSMRTMRHPDYIEITYPPFSSEYWVDEGL